MLQEISVKKKKKRSRKAEGPPGTRAVSIVTDAVSVMIARGVGWGSRVL